MLGIAETEPWGKSLRADLPAPGEGTLGYRLPGIEVRAKTGSLFNGASALSGWVRSTKSGRKLTFSILDKDAPTTVEDRLVRILSQAPVRIPHRKRTRNCVRRP